MIRPAELFRRTTGLPRVAFLDGRAARSDAPRSFVAWGPESTFDVEGDGTVRAPGSVATSDPLTGLDDFLLEAAAAGHTVIGAIAYELGRWIEPRSRIRARRGPLIRAARYTTCHCFDHLSDRWEGPVPDLEPVPPPLCRVTRPAPTITRAAYGAAFERILDWIRAGDIYQANLSIQFEAEITGDPTVFYERLAQGNPVPYGAYLDLGDRSILANTPELFLARRGSRLLTRPIKGTRPRGRSAEEDQERRHDLERDSKERAEHVMIVDLERNDLGRIAATGSVHVAPFERVETYATLHHMESTVSAELPDRTRVSEILRATFPGGSITGAPKIRAMEILDEVEDAERGFYTGVVFHVPPDGNFTMGLCIRTATVEAGRLRYRAGGGLVADSVADAEWAECLLKARALQQATEARR